MENYWVLGGYFSTLSETALLVHQLSTSLQKQLHSMVENFKPGKKLASHHKSFNPGAIWMREGREEGTSTHRDNVKVHFKTFKSILAAINQLDERGENASRENVRRRERTTFKMSH